MLGVQQRDGEDGPQACRLEILMFWNSRGLASWRGVPRPPSRFFRGSASWWLPVHLARPWNGPGWQDTPAPCSNGCAQLRYYWYSQQSHGQLLMGYSDLEPMYMYALRSAYAYSLLF